MSQNSTVSTILQDNLDTLGQIFHAEKNKDIVFRSFSARTGRKCFIAFLDGMADRTTINTFILRPLMLCNDADIQPQDLFQTNSFTETESISEAVTAILSGDTAIFADGAAACYICETKGFDKRGIGQPSTENSINGSQEAFCENLRSNTGLLRRILKTPRLCTEFVTVGEVNRSLVAVMYLDDVVSGDILDEIRKRLGSIRGDFIMGSGMLEQMIEDSPHSFFPSVLRTERPERAAHYLAGGRVVLIADGTPFALVLPVTLPLLLDSPEASSQRWQNGTYSRMIRLLALFCSTMLSGIYLALTLFHRDLIPTELLAAIVSDRSNIQFPSVFEVLLMEIMFELVREAGLRIPQAIGGAIGIVGALILGQSAVEANLVSPITLIVVALSGLGNAALPDYTLAFGLRAVKLMFILTGTFFGFLGIAVTLIAVLTVLVNQNSLGVSMLSAQALGSSSGTPLFYQKPLWKQELRPPEIHPQKNRQAPRVSRAWAWEQGEEG